MHVSLYTCIYSSNESLINSLKLKMTMYTLQFSLRYVLLYVCVWLYVDVYMTLMIPKWVTCGYGSCRVRRNCSAVDGVLVIVRVSQNGENPSCVRGWWKLLHSSQTMVWAGIIKLTWITVHVPGGTSYMACQTVTPCHVLVRFWVTSQALNHSNYSVLLTSGNKVSQFRGKLASCMELV